MAALRVDSKKLDRARQIRALTVDDLAKLSGRGYWQVWNTLKGRSAKPSTVKALCDALRLKMEEVVR